MPEQSNPIILAQSSDLQAVPESIRNKFLALKAEADKVLVAAQTLRIVDETTRELGTRLIVMAGTKAKELDDIRCFIVDPLNESLRRFNGVFNPTIKTLQEVKKTLARNVGLYVLEQEQKAKAARAEAERKAREETARLEREAIAAAENEAARIGLDVKAAALAAKMTPEDAEGLAKLYAQEAPQPVPVQAIAPAYVSPAKTTFAVQAPDGTVTGATLRRSYDFTVRDIDSVPPAFVKREIRRAETLAAIKAHVESHGEPPTIPGLDIFPVGTMVQR